MSSVYEIARQYDEVVMIDGSEKLCDLSWCFREANLYNTSVPVVVLDFLNLWFRLAREQVVRKVGDNPVFDTKKIAKVICNLCPDGEVKAVLVYKHTPRVYFEDEFHSLPLVDALEGLVEAVSETRRNVGIVLVDSVWNGPSSPSDSEACFGKMRDDAVFVATVSLLKKYGGCVVPITFDNMTKYYDEYFYRQGTSFAGFMRELGFRADVMYSDADGFWACCSADIPLDGPILELSALEFADMSNSIARGRDCWNVAVSRSRSI